MKNNIDSYVVYNTDITSVFEDAKLLRIVAVRIENDKIMNTFFSLINPDIRVNKDILKMCGIAK